MMPRHTDQFMESSNRRRISGSSSGFLSFCPNIISNYIALHMDSITKVLNHFLIMVLVFDIMLFFISFNVSFLPTVGFNTTTISLLLISQTILVWLIVNNNNLNQRNNNNHDMNISTSILSPTEFKIGLAFGLTVGATILSFMVSHAFRNANIFCNPLGTNNTTTTTTDPNHHLLRMLQQEIMTPPPEQPIPWYAQQQQEQQPPLPPPEPPISTFQQQQPQENINQQQQQQPNLSLYISSATDFTVECLQHSGSMNAIWFWAGLSFWCNFGICLLLWVGKTELGIINDNVVQYEHVNSLYGSGSHQQQQRPTGGSGSSSGGGTAFVGDYATVPEIRSDASSLHQNNNSVGVGSGSSSSGMNSVTHNNNSGYGPTGGYSDQPHLTSM